MPQTSKPPQFAVQSGQLFKSSGSQFSNNPFITSSASSFSTATTSGASLGGRSYVEASKTGGGLSDPRLEHTASSFAANKADPSSHGIDTQEKQPEQRATSQNPFAKATGFKLPKPKHVDVQGKMHAGASRLHVPAPPTSHQFVVTLSVRNIDQQMCTPEILHSHFQQFGHVSDLKCMPRKGMATVSYNDHVSLCNCYIFGTV